LDNEINILCQQRRDKLAALQEMGKDPFHTTTFNVDTHSIRITENFDEVEGKTVTVAGRLMSRRDMGKASFCDLQDQEGRVQIYISGDNIGADMYDEFNRKWDIGDIFGVVGEVFKTKRGEISVRAVTITLLAKSLQILPEKFHGLTDVDKRYRQRYVDLIMNPEVRKTFIKRSALIKAMRLFLDNRGFMEVETPILHTIPGGASARPFETHHNALHLDMSLRIAPELPLKKLIVGGFDRVYEIGRCFRNEGISIKHNPEFTSMELYQAYTDYHGMMELTESLFRHLAQEIAGSAKFEYQGQEIDFEAPFARISMVDAVKKYAGVDFDAIAGVKEAKEVAKAHKIHFKPVHSKGEILSFFFEEFAEEHLVQPTFVTDHPVEISFLSKADPTNPDYTQRFELFIGGREYANAFSELNDPIDQRRRFEHQEKLRQAGDDEASPIDEDFINALEVGLPPTGGLGVGIDRLVMLLTDSASIRDVLFFPTMKPLQ